MIRHESNRTSTPKNAEFLPNLVGQITGISSSSQQLSPRRKIRCGLFESDDRLSGHTLPSAQKVAAEANRIG
jgi:hypothetical protein